MKTQTEQEFMDAIPKPQTIWYKLWKAKQEIEAVKKNAKNPHFKNNYADINALIDAVEPVLLKYNLILLQPIEHGHVVTRIIDCDSGSVYHAVESSMKLPEISDPQKVGSAVTYFRRYTLQSLLSLQAEDDDAQSASQHVKNTKPSIDNSRFEKAIEAINNGKYTVQMLKDNYTLTQAQEEALKLL